MEKRRIILIILLVLILIVGAIVVIPLFSGSKGSGGTDTEPAAYSEAEMQEETEIINILPEVETQQIDGSVTATGAFESDTETGLEVHVDWSVFNNSEGRKVRLDVYLNCYNLYVSERYNGITIRLGDETKSINSAQIDYTGSANSILIGSTIMDMPDDPTDCEVSWEFKGTYNGTELEQVTASGTVG